MSDDLRTQQDPSFKPGLADEDSKKSNDGVMEGSEDFRCKPGDEQHPGQEPKLLTKRPASQADLFFYLLKPETPAHEAKVLVPLEASSKLMDALRNQVVLEFPTLVVLDQPPSNVPDGYVTEEEFYAKAKKEAAELENEPDYWEKMEQGSEQPEINQSHILEVLQKDTAG